jgi:septal ring factor EnvC (AmiA/AmiB activator)
MTEQNTEYPTEPMTESLDIAEYRTTAAALALLREQYAAPFDVTTNPGMTAAKAARVEIRGYRSALEKTRAEIKAPVLLRGQWIDAEAKRINAELLAIEEPIDRQIKAEETRKAEEKAARERAEAARVAALTARVYRIREQVIAVANQDAAAIREALAQAQAFEPDPEEFAEQWPEAMKAIAETRQTLATRLAEREAMEKWQAQREELARQQAELDRKQAEDDAQRKAEQEELARLRAAENARRQQDAEAQARAEEEARQKAEREAQARAEEEAVRAKLETLALAENPAHHKARRIIKDPLAAIKHALAAGTLTAPDAIDQAYRLGFAAGEQAAQHAA